MGTLNGKTLFVTGASRGIGLAIALRAAADGANVVVVAKTAEANPKLPGTIFTAAREIEQAGGKGPAAPGRHPVRGAARGGGGKGGGDVRRRRHPGEQRERDQPDGDAPDPDEAVRPDVRRECPWDRSPRPQALLPYLLKAKNPHILTLSPPLSLDPKWFGSHCAYTMAKYGMSMCVLGMAEEFREAGVAVNALWPRTVIATAALAMIPGVEVKNCRTPEIVADAAHGILTRDSRSCTGNFFLDDEVLAAEGVTDLSRYAVAPGAPLLPDLFL